MEEKQNPIYRYKLDNTTGEIIYEGVIKEYTKFSLNPYLENQFYYRWYENGRRYDIKGDSIDRLVVGGMYYSFCGDYDKVKECILEILKKRVDKSRTDYERVLTLYELATKGV